MADFSFLVTGGQEQPKNPEQMSDDELFGCPYCEEYWLKNGVCSGCGYKLELMVGDRERRIASLKAHPEEME